MPVDMDAAVRQKDVPLSRLKRDPPPGGTLGSCGGGCRGGSREEPRAMSWALQRSGSGRECRLPTA